MRPENHLPTIGAVVAAKDCEAIPHKSQLADEKGLVEGEHDNKKMVCTNYNVESL